MKYSSSVRGIGSVIAAIVMATSGCGVEEDAADPTLNAVPRGARLSAASAELASIAVTPQGSDLALGLARQLTATGTFSDGSTAVITNEVAWVSSEPAVVAITDSGLATARTLGTATVSATSGPITGATALSVTAPVLQRIFVDPPSLSIALGRTQRFHAAGQFSDGTIQDFTTAVTWASSNTAVGTILNTTGTRGQFTTRLPGSTFVSALFPSGGTVFAHVVVTPAVVVEMTTSGFSPLPRGTVVQCGAQATYSDGQVLTVTDRATWTSSDETVATISNASGSHGRITTRGVGSTTIRATVDGFTASTELFVTPPAIASLVVTPRDPQAGGALVQFTATGTFTDAHVENVTNMVSWGSSDRTRVVISNTDGSRGLATPVGQGQVIITAQSGRVFASTVMTVEF